MTLGPVLIAFAGLPGVGKTTLARRLATALGGVYLRADTIEGALREAGLQDIGGTGYMVGYALARENLLMGRCVVADSVNPWALTREAWRESARPAGVPFLDVEVVCSDATEHRRRVENRLAEGAGRHLPDWQAVVERDYHAFESAVDGSYLRLDTATVKPDEAHALICSSLEELVRNGYEASLSER